MPTAPIRILLVEDNPGDARLLREALREAGAASFTLREADRLAAARELLAAHPVDVVLLDLSLPDGHGIETVRQMLDVAPAVPLVVLTGLRDETVALEAVKAGAQDFLVKGQVESDVLVRALRYAMERKRLERERQELLEREQEARAVAEAAVRGRDEVLRVVSHDLGNYMTAVGIHARLLERHAGGREDGGEVLQRAATIQQLVRQMHGLRQDLLDVASLEAGRLSMDPQREEVPPLLREAAAVLEELSGQKRISVEVRAEPAPPPVHADRQRVLQVLSNLLGNAVKFTPEGGRVVLEAEAAGDAVRFRVADDGPGIAAEELPRLFDRFYRAQRRDRSGAGLGLAIARGIVEAHGGRIGVESTPGAGTIFHFTLPMHRPEG